MWGEGSKDYSEEVIKNYICRHGSIVLEQRARNNNNARGMGGQLSLSNLASIHAGGSTRNSTDFQFGRKIVMLITAMGM